MSILQYKHHLHRHRWYEITRVESIIRWGFFPSQWWLGLKSKILYYVLNYSNTRFQHQQPLNWGVSSALSSIILRSCAIIIILQTRNLLQNCYQWFQYSSTNPFQGERMMWLEHEYSSLKHIIGCWTITITIINGTTLTRRKCLDMCCQSHQH